MSVTLYNADCLEAMQGIPAGSVDAVIFDPPYGIGLSSWDTVVDIAAVLSHAKRMGREFVAFFGQMPTLADWHNEAVRQNLSFCEHITWVKRCHTPSGRLCRSMESIYVYAIGKRRKFYTTRGPYEDVKVPGILVDTMTVEGIQRYIADLRLKSEGKSVSSSRSLTQQPEFQRFQEPCLDRSPKDANFTNVWSFLGPGRYKRDSNYDHPTKKTEPLMARLCEMLTTEGGSVLDPFMGSGTTGVAAIQTGRNFIGIERDAGYFEIAGRRICEAQDALL